MGAGIYANFEADVLAYDPFAGDFGDTSDRTFHDKMVTAAKAHDDCHICGGGIEKGERHRSMAGKFDGELMAWRWCWACCTAMARVRLPYDGQNEPDREICDRTNIRFLRNMAA